MKLESQVVNLELSKRLKELGVKQESLFYWVSENSIASKHDTYSFIDDEYYCGSPEGIGDVYEIKFVYSAFTASELLEMLPDYIDMSGHLKIKKHDVRGEGITYFVEYGYGYYEEQDHNLSNSLSKTLITLIENKIIEV